MAQPGWYAKHPRRERKDAGGKGNWKILCRNTRRIGSEYEARLGSFVVYREWLGNAISPLDLEPQYRTVMARVIGRVDRSGTGEPLMVGPASKQKRGWWLHVMALNETGRFLMQRYVNPADVECIVPVPTAMARFFFGPWEYWPDEETCVALSKHGSLSNEFIDAAMQRIGNLRVSDGDVFHWALNRVEDFRVAVAKAAKQGRMEQKKAKEKGQDA